MLTADIVFCTYICEKNIYIFHMLVKYIHLKKLFYPF